MGLTNFLFRCPFCGHDPLEGEGERAGCAGCGRAFRRSRGGTFIIVDESEVAASGGPGARFTASPADLARALDQLGGAFTQGEGAGAPIWREARVRVRIAREEAPVRYRGRLLGFYERFGPRVEGDLSLDEHRMRFAPDDGAGVREWPLLEVRALQSSSSALQISPAEGGVVTFRFPFDSSRRWELLVSEALRRAWRARGRGEIVEFQPRIRGARR